MKLPFLSFIVLLLLSGCLASAIGTLQISEPYFGNGDQKYLLKDGVALLEGLSIAVVPINYQRSQESAGPLIFPIVPVGGDSRYQGQGKHFRVVIELEASSSDISFDPGIVDLQIGNEAFHPVRTSSPYRGVYGTRTAWYRALPGHAAWACDYREEAPLGKEVRTAMPISDRACFAVEFAVDTPAPSQEFSVRIRALMRDGVVISAPTFRFRPSTATYAYRVM